MLNHCLVLLTAHQFSSEFTASRQPVLLWRRAEGQGGEATDFRLHEKKQQCQDSNPGLLSLWLRPRPGPLALIPYSLQTSIFLLFQKSLAAALPKNRPD